MKIALAQINSTVGDIAANTRKAADFISRAKDLGAELVVFSELSIVGYPPRDLLAKEQFVADSLAAVQSLAAHCTDISALVGFVRPNPTPSGRTLQNAAALLEGGSLRHVHVKSLLPTYDVFDETRYFEPGPPGEVIKIAAHRVGLSICEDLWDADALGRELYGRDPIAMLVDNGAEIIINMAASPFHMGKAAEREKLFARQARRNSATIVYVNQVGGNDELVFDGASCVLGPDGRVRARGASFEEDMLIVDTEADSARIEPIRDTLDSLWSALKLGLHDYAIKCGFRSAVLGLSGGIDSAVVAALAADALGAGNVYALAMPSRYSSDHSLADAEALATNLGIKYRVVPIETIHKAYELSMSGWIDGPGREIAAENVQARIRGNLIMALSNAEGHLPLATGNKSELSVGYCTLYGDMTGGLAPIGDVLKTVVFQLAEFLNEQAGADRIPRNIITKPPSAELKPNQFDQDSLPPYDLLDAILTRYVGEDRTAGEMIAGGLDEATVRAVISMVDSSEYKRRQAAPVLKVTSRAFGTGRRMPIVQRYRPLPARNKEA